MIKKQYGMDLNFAGAGAAGGLGAGAKFGLDATIESGFRVIASLTGLEEKIQQMTNSDRLITGEGNFDQQSLQGKVISGILALAKKYQRKVIILAGNSQLTNLQNYPEIEKIITLVDQDISLEQSLKEPDSVLRKRCQSLREYLQIESLLKPSIET
jgi:glycerate kinase